MRLLAFSLIGLTWVGCGASAANSFSGDGGSASGGAVAFGGAGTGAGTTTSTFVTTSTQSTSGQGGASTSSSSSSSSGATTSSGGVGGGAPVPSGDCQKGSDCASGQCVAVTPGGYQVCVVPPAPATTCTSALDQCCPSTAMLCAGGAPCYVGPLVPVCAGTPMAVHNVCGVDQCSTDVDCAPGQICGIAGTLGLEIRACVTAHCKLDSDCNTYPGGVCAPVQEPCCGATAGLFCTYETLGGCQKDADCPPTGSQPTRYCDPNAITGIASCQPGAAVCPA